MEILTAQYKSLTRRPPPEFFLAGYFGYEGTSRTDAAEMELPESLPLYEP
jgi:hypothetical protein